MLADAAAVPLAAAAAAALWPPPKALAQPAPESLVDYLNQTGRGSDVSSRTKLWSERFPLETYARKPTQNVILLHTIWGEDVVALSLPKQRYAEGEEIAATVKAGSVAGFETELAGMSRQSPANATSLPLGKAKAGVHALRVVGRAGTTGPTLAGYLFVLPADNGLDVFVKMMGEPPPEKLAGRAPASVNDLTTGADKFFANFTGARFQASAGATWKKWVAGNAVAIGHTFVTCVVLVPATAWAGAAVCATSAATNGADLFASILVTMAKDMEAAGILSKAQREALELAFITLNTAVQAGAAFAGDAKRVIRVVDSLLAVLEKLTVTLEDEKVQFIASIGVQEARKVLFLFTLKPK